MCGIYGFQLRPGAEMSEYERTMMSFILADEMESRGRDSFGGIGIPTEEDEEKVVRVIRGTGRVSTCGRELFKLAVSSRSFLGHTRAATKGSISIENSHPFRLGDVLGLHNGVITNHDHLNHKYSRDFAVDSMHIFAHLDEGKSLEELWGYGTFFWLRSSENWKPIWFARTNAGQLTIGKIFRSKEDQEAKNHFAVIWASERMAIERVCQMLGFTLQIIHTDEDEIYKIEQAIVYETQKKICFGSHYKGRGYIPLNTKEATTEEVDEYGGVWGFNQWWDRSEGCRVNPPKTQAQTEREKHLTRNERKALRKKQRKLREQREETTVEHEWIADPTPENIYSGYRLKAVYIPDPETEGKTDKQFLCDECECLLADHIWGFCQHNIAGTSCKAKNRKYACDMPQISSCSDCGHALVAGVHSISVTTGLFKLVECEQCHNYCAPEGVLVNSDSDDASEPEAKAEDDTKQEPADKPTEIVLRNNNPYGPWPIDPSKHDPT